jgi:hypothetical protein
MSDTRLNPTEEKKARNDRKKQVIRSYPPTPKGINRHTRSPFCSANHLVPEAATVGWERLLDLTHPTD